MFSGNKILFLEQNIDFQNLKPGLEKLNIQTEFVADTDGFSKRCDEKVFDIVVFSSLDEQHLDGSLLDIISDSVNFQSTILVITDGNETVIDEILNNHFEFIHFPYKPEIFISRLKQQLRKTESYSLIHNNLVQLSSVLNNLPLGVLQTDSAGKILSLNDRVTKILGMTENDIEKENFFHICHPEDYFIIRKQLDRLLKKEIEKGEFEIRLINNEGATAVCDVTVSVIWKKLNEFGSFLLLLREKE